MSKFILGIEGAQFTVTVRDRWANRRGYKLLKVRQTGEPDGLIENPRHAQASLKWLAEVVMPALVNDAGRPLRFGIPTEKGPLVVEVSPGQQGLKIIRKPR